jgi:hypothetical protein
VGSDGAGDLAGERADLGDDRDEGGGEPGDGVAARFALEFADRGGRGVAQSLEQLLDGTSAAVGVAGEEALQALGAEAARVVGAGVAAQEGERDRAVDVGEDSCGAGPGRVELGAQLVGQVDAHGDEVLARADQRSQRDGLVADGASVAKRW